MDLVKKLASEVGVTEQEIKAFLHLAPRKYKVYTIPKRKSGVRVIAQPTSELKKLQRKFVKIVNFPTHECSMAYKKGVGIKQNAEIHQANTYLLKMDLENFFNSISPDIFWKVWSEFNPLPTSVDKLYIEKLLFWCPSKKNSNKLILSVGAPSSPNISNFCMSKFDDVVSKFCQDRNIIFTRYADDLTFSTKKRDVLFEVPSLVQHALSEEFGRRLTINHSKTTFSSMAHNRHITGITINNEGNLSIGRDKKRYIKHLVHQFKYNNLDEQDIYHLKGLLAFAKYIEPSFLGSLNEKYSFEVMKKIIRGDNEEV
ncbi:retron St85 family RNA-directed DNA polymerase [Vibrio campbellii]|uniref:retron St85 family RNA-directed DNA polymerase n=1 Tax=Vibrio campbellii TaxID=680 RepID=UPI0005F07547|nr:retron St85 family RNA-directed DNA polymerase [Vibrio campbellii]